MIDLEKMRELISDGIAGDKRWRDTEGEALSALEELISEVERLRLDSDDIEHSYSFARDKAKLLERQAVVAYLRGLADDYGVCIDLSLAEQAEKIERGEHRNES